MGARSTMPMKASSSATTIWTIGISIASAPQQIDGPIESDAARRLEEHQVADPRCEVPIEDDSCLVGVSRSRDPGAARRARSLRDPAPAFAGGDQAVRRLRGPGPDLPMQALLVRPQLEHVAQH